MTNFHSWNFMRFLWIIMIARTLILRLLCFWYLWSATPYLDRIMVRNPHWYDRQCEPTIHTPWIRFILNFVSETSWFPNRTIFPTSIIGQRSLYLRLSTCAFRFKLQLRMASAWKSSLGVMGRYESVQKLSVIYLHIYAEDPVLMTLGKLPSMQQIQVQNHSPRKSHLPQKQTHTTLPHHV